MINILQNSAKRINGPPCTACHVRYEIIPLPNVTWGGGKTAHIKYLCTDSDPSLKVDYDLCGTMYFDLCVTRIHYNLVLR